VVAVNKPFIVVLGKPGGGKSSVLRQSFSEVRDSAAFLDGDHDFEQMMHLVHECGFQRSSYFYCPVPEELPSIVEERTEPFIFIDTPRLTEDIVTKVAKAAKNKKVVLAVTSTDESLPSELEPLVSDVIILRENREEVKKAIVELLESSMENV
jgi:hypothetical protein